MTTPPLVRLFVFIMCATSATAAGFDQISTRPPVAAKHPKDVTVHGDPRTDDYFWLRAKEDPSVRPYLESENAYTEAVMAPERALRDTLFTEMRSRIKEDDTSAPVSYLGYLYYTRTEKDRQYPIYCRRADRADAPEEILVDLNKLGEGKPYVAVGHYRVSNDGRRLAYSIDWTGYRQYEVFVLELATHQFVPQQIGKVSDVDWAAGSDVLYYATENESKRSNQLHRWTLSTGRQETLYTENDELYNLSVGRTRDSQYILCESSSKLTSEVRAFRADDPAAAARVLVPREDNHEYHADHHDGRFYFISNKGAKNSRVVSAPDSAPGDWTEVIAHRPMVKIDGIDPFATHLVIHGREHGLPQLEVYDFATKSLRRLEQPDEVYDLAGDQNWTYDATEYRYRYQSLPRPPSVFSSSLTTGERRLLKETEVLGDFQSSRYRTERLWATARDGTRVPLSVVYRRDLDRTRPAPLYLYGYGSYGISMPITFSANRLSLLDRGVIYVIAHIRGGGELGEDWREAGRMERKMTTFTDFVDCAQWLVDQGWTTPGQMVTSGGSAGGLLMGATLNLRPDLFRAMKFDVPFVDVLNTMLDATLPLTPEEYVEWGNPNLPREYAWMRAYSPYDNLHKTAYPHLLVNVSYFDSQVPYWEGAKLLAKARTLNTADTVLLLHTNFSAGHGGSAGRFDALHDVARDYAFFLSALGLAK